MAIPSITPNIPSVSRPTAPAGGREAPARPGTPATSTATPAPSSEPSISKVARMRAAIESGTFVVNPERVMTGLLESGDLGHPREWWSGTAK